MCLGGLGQRSEQYGVTSWHQKACVASKSPLQAGQGRAGQGRAGQGRAGQGRAGQGRAAALA
jgi:hypothetical protein